MTRGTRGSLSAAGITVIERHSAAGWNGQVQEYLVSVEARDRDDAVSRVAAVLAARGSFMQFAPAGQ
jgi:hypothetical protein